ncbi:O-antigen ligase family protein [Rufibacter psychrotolerans]|uniref:O-antigen ligase family protein n=1 Tax=Rufibacter psychrotolerans TaxID=2812556 RepID=UPI0019685CED|nr:O-antigen ligase family protein [Rufibacter sp. SYSU D00308]
MPGLILSVLLVLPFVFSIFKEPKVGLVAFMGYCFIFNLLAREIGNFPYLYVIETLLVLSWLSVLFHTNKEFEWANIKNEICVLGFGWMMINILQLFNPASSNILGWMLDFRYTLLWILAVPLCMLVFNKNKDLNTFLILIIAFSLLATLNGVKQIKLGLSQAEQTWLATSGYVTHVIFGELRAFSFYTDASQFGASQAHLFVVALVLAFGPFKLWKRVLCALAAMAFLYGESISGTRGALFTIFIGLGVVVFINKNFKVTIIAITLVVTGFCFLKFTTIGQSHFEIRRMRSALRPHDASFNTRLTNQVKIQRYLDSHPFGGGVGAIGFTGRNYNQGTYLASIPPDSYWVKIWAEYGTPGFVIWISLMMYIIGKSCGIVWRTKDKGLKFKLTALTAGFTGIIISSYSNEIMNMMPSSMIIYVSWAFIFQGPRLDKEAQQLEPQPLEAHA